MVVRQNGGHIKLAFSLLKALFSVNEFAKRKNRQQIAKAAKQKDLAQTLEESKVRLEFRLVLLVIGAAPALTRHNEG